MPIVHHAIDVAAPPEQCWRIFSDLGSWPRWFPFLGQVDGELRAGGRLTLHLAAGQARLQVGVTIEEFEPSRRVRWVGGRMGVRGDHFYEFAMNIPGTTRVTSRECFSGPAARLLRGPLFAMLDGEVHQSMERFKALVEAARP